MDAMCSLKGFDCPALRAYHFNEFVVRTPVQPEKLNKLLLKKGIIGGLPLASHVPEMGDHMLFATTELHTDEDHGQLVAALEEVA